MSLVFLYLNDNPLSAKAALNLGKDAGPIPCSFKIYFSLYFESSASVVIPWCSNARLAGAESRERKPSFGFLSFSQVGQVGQSLLL